MAEMNSLMNADLYKPNSNKSKRQGAEAKQEVAEKPPKDIQKVVKGNVSSKEASFIKKAAMSFVPDDTTQNIKTYLLFDVFIPTIKDTFMNVMSMLVYGGEIRTGGRGGSYNYNGITNKKNTMTKNSAYRTVNRKAVHDFREVTFQTRGDAMEVLSRMNELIEDYGTCTVEDFYIYIGEGGNAKHTDRNWGWSSLQGVNVSRVLGGGYCIDLPRVERLE